MDKTGKQVQYPINAIPNNMEKYLAFMVRQNLTFID